MERRYSVLSAAGEQREIPHLSPVGDIPEVLELVRSVQAKFNPSLKIAGILITMYQSKPQLCESIRESVVDVYGTKINVFSHPIEYTIKLAEAPAAGQSIFVYRPQNPAAVSYRCLAEEVLQLE
jgi:cobyrinic acid ac-diamide synthase